MNQGKILVVEDEDNISRLLTAVLEFKGYQDIQTAHNGQEGIEKYKENKPNLVLMDLEMPVMNGYEAARQIKSRFPATRLVVLSVHAGAKERENARAAGADGFVVKGVSYEVLVNAILGRDDSTNLSPIKGGEEP